MADFGFVGPSYEAPSIYQDAQECINFYVEIDPLKPQGSRGYVALYPTPGLTEVCQLSQAEVRGMYTMPGSTFIIAVAGADVYKIEQDYTKTKVGTLDSYSGQVSITSINTAADGLVAYIADGDNRYYYIVKPTDPDTTQFEKLPKTDGPWIGANVVDIIDNYVIYNEPDTNNWACTDLESQFSENAYYGTKDGEPDNIVSLIADHRQVYLLGEWSTEVWVDVGNVIQGIISFPFQRVSGTMMQHGCAAPFSVAQFEEQIMFVSKDARGQGIIGAVQGYTFVRLSNHAVEQTLMNQNISDATAYTYRLEGHEFYVVTFPSIDLTWVYDLTTQSWHKWLSVDNFDNYHRHRSNCGCYFNNVYLVGDFENGKIYQLDNNVYTDNGNKIKRLRRAPHIVTDLQRQYFSEFQIQFQPGVGLQTGQGQNPQAMLRWSNDGGSTWSNEHWTSIGKVGRYQNRAIWRRLGWSRDRIYEVVVSDPIRPVVVSANLKAEEGDN